MLNEKKRNYRYKDGVDPIFTEEYLKEYSPKISNIMETIKKTEGIVLIYSQYIEGVVFPLLLLWKVWELIDMKTNVLCLETNKHHPLITNIKLKKLTPIKRILNQLVIS